MGPNLRHSNSCFPINQRASGESSNLRFLQRCFVLEYTSFLFHIPRPCGILVIGIHFPKRTQAEQLCFHPAAGGWVPQSCGLSGGLGKAEDAGLDHRQSNVRVLFSSHLEKVSRSPRKLGHLCFLFLPGINLPCDKRLTEPLCTASPCLSGGKNSL